MGFKTSENGLASDSLIDYVEIWSQSLPGQMVQIESCFVLFITFFFRFDFFRFVANKPLPLILKDPNNQGLMV